LYAFAARSHNEVSVLAERLCRRFGLNERAFFATNAANQGARLFIDQ
jgi:hypothetical protein